MTTRTTLLSAAAAFCAVLAIPASAQLRSFTGYNSSFLPANDDGSTGHVSTGFSANFFGTTYTQLYVNNNGNLTFDSPLATFTPFGLAGSNRAIIAPFFADVDTRAVGSNPVTYGSGVLGGHNAFAANYIHVGDYNFLQIFNTFQVVLIDRSDIAAGDFDFEFNYSMINWETGQASGGNSQGLHGNPVRVGFSSGGVSPTSFELPGSGVSGFFLDNVSTGLIHNQLGVPFDGDTELGRYDFSVRNGQVIIPDPVPQSGVPEPSTYGLFGAVALLAFAARRRFSKK